MYVSIYDLQCSQATFFAEPKSPFNLLFFFLELYHLCQGAYVFTHDNLFVCWFVRQ